MSSAARTTTSRAVPALLLLLAMPAAAAAQDFVFGVHTGSTRLVSGSAPARVERGSSLGLAGAIEMKPWAAFQIELLWTDKGKLGPNSGPHRWFEVPYMARLSSPWPVLGVRPFGVLGAAEAWELTCVTGCADRNHVSSDVSTVKGVGASAQVGRWQFAFERRTTDNLRTLLVHVSYVIHGIVPDWM